MTFRTRSSSHQPLCRTFRAGTQQPHRPDTAPAWRARGVRGSIPPPPGVHHGTLVRLILFSLALLCPARSGTATVLPESEAYNPDEATRGSLLFHGDDAGSYIPAPVLNMDVTIAVSGMVSRATVRQEFRNPGDTWTEGIYVFPLPESAAVDHMRMYVGDRIIEGQIKEREEAKRTYEQAKQSGQRASLVEQERPNIFTTSVANIAPHATIIVEIEYQETVRYESGQFHLRFPMVVGPRNIPGAPIAHRERVNVERGTGWAPDTDQVLDASRVTPPVAHPDEGALNPVRLTVHLDAGIPLASIASPYHRVQIEASGPDSKVITVREDTVPADRDFALQWAPAVDAAPKAALFTQLHEGDSYALFMVVPPELSADGDTRIPREVIFVVDTSGSMHGSSITQARKALSYGLERLHPHDRFNVIQFNDRPSALFPDSVTASEYNVRNAIRYVKKLEANGGTEMRSALEAALITSSPTRSVRQVIFMTDGSVGNEDQLFSFIQQHLGDSRLFTVGIGSAPNSHFMTKAAQFGRGTFTYIGRVEEVAEHMTAMLRKLEHPALADIEIDIPGRTDGELYPVKIPDLYLGEPVVVAARFKTLPERAVIRGRTANATWETELHFSGGQSQPGVSVLWARRKIADLMEKRQDGAEAAAIRQSVIDVALTHHLVSKYTSLVAIDVTPVRPATDTLNRHAMTTNLPEGWTYEKVFGTGQGASSARLHALAGLLALASALLALRLRMRTV